MFAVLRELRSNEAIRGISWGLNSICRATHTDGTKCEKGAEHETISNSSGHLLYLYQPDYLCFILSG
jgi:hypothetical protein